MPATLTDRVAELQDEAQAILDRAADEQREPTDVEAETFERTLGQIRQLSALDESTRQARAILDRPAGTDTAPTRQSFGQEFVDSHVVRDLRAQYPAGIPSSQAIATGAAEVGRIRNALLTDPAVAEPRHVVDAPTGQAGMTLLDAITIVDDAPRAISHFTATLTNAAATVEDGDPVPESTLTWASVDLTQKWIGTHLPIDNAALDHNPMLRQYVDGFLVSGVRATTQATVGTQLAAWSGLASQAFDTDMRTSLRKGITKAQVAAAATGAGPISIAISAADAETLDLEMLSTLTIPPGSAPQPVGNIWRANLVVVPAGLASGFAYVGDLRQVVWYTSGGLQVSLGHVGTQFTDNQQTVKAGGYGVAGVLNAGAIVKTDIVA